MKDQGQEEMGGSLSVRKRKRILVPLFTERDLGEAATSDPSLFAVGMFWVRHLWLYSVPLIAKPHVGKILRARREVLFFSLRKFNFFLSLWLQLRVTCLPRRCCERLWPMHAALLRCLSELTMIYFDRLKWFRCSLKSVPCWQVKQIRNKLVERRHTNIRWLPAVCQHHLVCAFSSNAHSHPGKQGCAVVLAFLSSWKG